MTQLRDIGLRGDAGAGKTTAAHLLRDVLGYRHRAFADELKIEVGQAFFDYPPGPSRWSREARSRVEAHKPALRSTLQAYGMAKRAVHGDDVWIDRCLRWFEGEEIIEARRRSDGERSPRAVSDVRLPNEIARLVRENFVIVRIVRPDYDGDLTEEQRAHISERALDDLPSHVEVVNDGTLDDLLAKLTPIARGEVDLPDLTRLALP